MFFKKRFCYLSEIFSSTNIQIKLKLRLKNKKKHVQTQQPCVDPESFVRVVTSFFVVDEAREDSNTTKSGLSSAPSKKLNGV